jgi:uncharacterized glyoxalase superfamily protein PhnB
MKIHVNAITFAVKNVALLKDFYTERFGLEVISENEKVTILKLDNLLLTLCEEALFNQYANINNRAEGKGFYLTINLPSKDAVDERLTELINRGIQISRQPAPAFWGGYSGFIADPEGNSWEICYNPYAGK